MVLVDVTGSHLKRQPLTLKHIWILPGNYPVFTVMMVIYRYIDIIAEFLLLLIFWLTYMIMNKYYPGEPVKIHIQSLINMIQKKNRVITTVPNLPSKNWQK